MTTEAQAQQLEANWQDAATKMDNALKAHEAKPGDPALNKAWLDALGDFLDANNACMAGMIDAGWPGPMVARPDSPTLDAIKDFSQDNTPRNRPQKPLDAKDQP